MRKSRRQKAWSTANPGNRAIRAEIERALLDAAAPAIAGAGDLLDVGCGTGWWLESLAAHRVAPERLYGLEAAQDRVRAAAERAPGATVVAGDARRLPWEDDRFAAVFLLLVLASLPGRGAVREALAEARRVLAPGGVIVVWEPRVPTPWNRSTRWLRAGELRAAAGREESSRALTMLPPLARRLGPAADTLYPIMSRGPLRTHRLTVWRA